MSLVRQNTPWEIHNGIHVKREDLSCPQPGPSFSKIRGVDANGWPYGSKMNQWDYWSGTKITNTSISVIAW